MTADELFEQANAFLRSLTRAAAQPARPLTAALRHERTRREWIVVHARLAPEGKEVEGAVLLPEGRPLTVDEAVTLAEWAQEDEKRQRKTANAAVSPGKSLRRRSKRPARGDRL
jgi:hypothetical protein